MKTRITDIVDNRAMEGFIAEHGLSLLIEREDECILFDTGAGAALRPNAAKLGIDLDGVTRIVLSHSHNDHTGGLGGLEPKGPVHIGDGFGVPCFSRHADGSVHSLAVPPDAKAVLSAADVRVGRCFEEVAKGVFLSGRIARMSGEDNGKSFYCDESCTARNFVGEEQSLLTEDGVLVTGCCHAGIVNTVRAFRLAVPHIAVRVIVGGLHLCHATDDEIERTGDFLRQFDLERLVLLHCTGEAAGAKLKEMLACPVVWGSAGSVLVEVRLKTPAEK